MLGVGKPQNVRVDATVAVELILRQACNTLYEDIQGNPSVVADGPVDLHAELLLALVQGRVVCVGWAFENSDFEGLAELAGGFGPFDGRLVDGLKLVAGVGREGKGEGAQGEADDG